ncbi:hypothetical protein VHUM_02824 [Vanrija humicola]|uniref:L-ornithine N(5)-monooxygenase [NAD(P)H] n=1 Tax=Vanrija humicola TaxID=5417 RepID=A0A7D8V0U4_VANHU|nr:hypothetical protein VHUM_02824 [Vanrija humicola]
MYERMGGVGGTWWTNRYPLTPPSVPVVVYSHSRFPNPNWTETHPSRAEMQQYWQDITEEQNLTSRINLNSNVIRADWDAKRKVYYVTIEGPNGRRVIETNIIVSAAGGLSNPRMIDAKNRSLYKGTLVHAADWPEELTIDSLKGKHVVVVGNGCSGVQIIGELGTHKDINITGVARTKQWFVPSDPLRPYGPQKRHSVPYPAAVRALFKYVPLAQWLNRVIMIRVMDSLFYLYLDKEGAKSRKWVEKRFGNWMLKRLPEEMHKDAIPDHAIGARRLIFEDGYFEALNQPNVKAIRGKVVEFKESSVILDTGDEVKADVVVLATGYDAETKQFEVNGAVDKTSNYRSNAEWQMYHGVSMPGMPNWFAMLGNNTGINHMSILAILEINANYITQLIKNMRDYDVKELAPKKEKAVEYDNWVQKELHRTTWYQTETYWRTGGGKGKIFTHYPGSVAQFQRQNNYPEFEDYEGGEVIVKGRRNRKILRTLLLVGAIVAASYTTAGSQAKDAVVNSVEGVLHKTYEWTLNRIVG